MCIFLEHQLLQYSEFNQWLVTAMKVETEARFLTVVLIIRSLDHVSQLNSNSNKLAFQLSISTISHHHVSVYTLFNSLYPNINIHILSADLLDFLRSVMENLLNNQELFTFNLSDRFHILLTLMFDSAAIILGEV